MSIKQILAEHFMGKNLDMTFHENVNKISGPNGSGKSSVKEATCFLFTGCDSHGKRNPQHLISRSEDRCKVTVITDKAKISRTLTRGGNGTLRIVKNDGVAINMGQQDFSRMIGSEDLFLSIYVPGYFVDMTAPRQHKVFSEVTEKFDRFSLLNELSGITMSPEEVVKYRLNDSDRLDRVSNNITEDRRATDREFNQLSGELKGLSEQIVIPPMPENSNQQKIYNELSELDVQWSKYHADVIAFDKSVENVKKIKKDNEIKKFKRSEIENRLSKIVYPEILDCPSRYFELTDLRNSLKSHPGKPAAANVASVGHCSACGQIVSEKHRESVVSKNTELMRDYSASCVIIDTENKSIREKILEIEKQEKESRDKHNKQIMDLRRAEKTANDLKIEIAKIVDQQVPMGSITKPIEPYKVVLISDVQAAKKNLEQYKHAISEHEYYQDKAEKADSRTVGIRSQIKMLAQQVSRLRELEAGVQKLPDYEIRKKSEMFHINEFVKLVVDKTVSMTIGGLPYHMESTGNQMKANTLLSLKLNILAKTPVNIMFVDNSDLVDELPVEESGMQIFTAIVDDGSLTVE